MASNDKEDLEAEGLIANSYTAFFAIRKRMRRIQDIVIPLREGIGVDQGVAFILALIVMAILYGLFVSPLIEIFEISLNLMFFILWFIAPAVLVSQRISKPMPHNKTISGYVSSIIRSKLDDPVHRRGIPQRSRPRAGKTFHYQREYAIHPNFASAPPPDRQSAAPDDALTYTGPAVELGSFMASRASEHSERARIERESARKEGQVKTRSFLLAPRHHVVDDDL